MTTTLRRRSRTFPANNLLKMFNPETKPAALADALGASRSTIHKWATYNKQISLWAADRYSVKIGCHPSELWHDWYDV